MKYATEFFEIEGDVTITQLSDLWCDVQRGKDVFDCVLQDVRTADARPVGRFTHVSIEGEKMTEFDFVDGEQGMGKVAQISGRLSPGTVCQSPRADVLECHPR